MKVPIGDSRIIHLKTKPELSGKLTAVEGERDIPFEIRRVFYIYEMPVDTVRARHAHKKLHQLIISVSGCFDVLIDDTSDRKTIRLSQPSGGLYIPPMIWCELSNFTNEAVCLVLASDIFDESDYYRKYDDFLLAQRSRLD
jgi:dTDP-4-dehydrorhamnose 3,5-epimerase-like enzyme